MSATIDETPWHRKRCVALALAMGLTGGFAQAQTADCRATPRLDPPGQVLACPGGLTIRVEAGSAFSLVDRNRDGRPEAVRLDGRAVLIDAPASRSGFQVLTPHAIAAVRGTLWAVDVTPGQTSVFVERGRVAVRRPGGAAVTLGPGDGVDVKPGREPLTVVRWGAARVAALLARFGR